MFLPHTHSFIWSSSVLLFKLLGKCLPFHLQFKQMPGFLLADQLNPLKKPMLGCGFVTNWFQNIHKDEFDRSEDLPGLSNKGKVLQVKDQLQGPHSATSPRSYVHAVHGVKHRWKSSKHYNYQPILHVLSKTKMIVDSIWNNMCLYSVVSTTKYRCYLLKQPICVRQDLG